MQIYKTLLIPVPIKLVPDRFKESHNITLQSLLYYESPCEGVPYKRNYGVPYTVITAFKVLDIGSESLFCCWGLH